MADNRFFDKINGLTLAQIAKAADVVLPENADESRVFKDVADLKTANGDDVSWAFIPKVREDLKNTKAGAVIVPQKFVSFVPNGCLALVAKDAHRSYGLLAQAFYPAIVDGVIHPSAVIDPSAKLGEGCRVDAGAVIGETVQLGDRCHIGANAVIGRGVQMGNDCIVGPTATVSHCFAGN